MDTRTFELLELIAGAVLLALKTIKYFSIGA
jgi:hypothetical protein